MIAQPRVRNRLVDVGADLPADTQASKPVQEGEGGFGEPAMGRASVLDPHPSSGQRRSRPSSISGSSRLWMTPRLFVARVRAT